MENNYTQRITQNLVLTVLLSASVVASLPSDVAAQKRMTERECLKRIELVQTKALAPRETVMKARRYCAKGDLSGAYKLLGVRTGF